MPPPPQWADTPYALISTLAFSHDTSHSALYIATQMSLAHNGIIRGLNSIYLQAPHLPSQSPSSSPSSLTITRDFLTYCQCWSESMHHHHAAEEEIYFPAIESISGVEGLMEGNVKQHQAFGAGFEAFERYVRECEVGEFDGWKLRELVEGFGEPLVKHLHDEIETLRALEIYDSGRLREAYEVFVKSLMATDNQRIAPLVFGTADRNFENGVHDFPAVPFFVPWVIHYVFARRHRGAWRFNPCTMWRERRELEFGG